MSKGKKGSVLVVDDDTAVLKATTKLLHSYGYKVFSSSNVNDAIDNLQNNNSQFTQVYVDLSPPISSLQWGTPTYSADFDYISPETEINITASDARTTTSHIAALFTLWGNEKAMDFMNALKANHTTIAICPGM